MIFWQSKSEIERKITNTSRNKLARINEQTFERCICTSLLLFKKKYFNDDSKKIGTNNQDCDR